MRALPRPLCKKGPHPTLGGGLLVSRKVIGNPFSYRKTSKFSGSMT